MYGVVEWRRERRARHGDPWRDGAEGLEQSAPNSCILALRRTGYDGTNPPQLAPPFSRPPLLAMNVATTSLTSPQLIMNVTPLTSHEFNAPPPIATTTRATRTCARTSA